MNIFRQAMEAFESLNSNKLRSGLTMLGIIIVVAAVISMLAIGQGAQDSITNSINAIGTNVVFIFPNRGRNTRNARPLTLSDARAMEDPSLAPSVLAVSPIIEGNSTVTFDSQSTSTSIVGIYPNYAIVRNLTVTEGSLINMDNVNNVSAVAVIGSQVATNLFGRTDNLVDEIINISGQPFKIIGVLTSQGGGGFGSQDNQILVPFTTAQARLISKPVHDQVDQIVVQAVDAKSTTLAADEVTQILLDRHQVTATTEDFQVLNQAQLLTTASSVTGILTIFLGGIAGISLLVGRIGIMNIMFVSVTERTREIGLRKALGARKRDILSQFLIESAVLSLLGGLVGIGLSWLISFIIDQIAASGSVSIHSAIHIEIVLLATLFSAAVGLFFGYYPARRAANLQPVEALRYE